MSINSEKSMGEIKELLQSENPEDLQSAREMTRELLTEMTSKIASIFLDRLVLMGLIASSKRQSEAILQLDREYDLIMKFSQIAQESGEDGRMVQMLIWLITAAGKEKQRQILGRENVYTKENISPEVLRQNLLHLTAEVANNYGEYGEGFNATKLAKEIGLELMEKHFPKRRENALDLGCANGCTSEFLSQQGFKHITGYDISPDMIQAAENLYGRKNIDFVQKDLFNGIPVDDNSVDFVVADFGSASEVHDSIIRETNRVLRQGGKAVLSFYNSESLMSRWWQPWQSSLEVVVNPENDFIEVPLIKQDGTHEVFKIYAKSQSVDEIKTELSGTDLHIDATYSHSFVTSMMPPIFFDDEKRVGQIREYERAHAGNAPYLGHYLVFVLSK